MKVLHVIPAVAPRYGGPSVAVHGMTRELARQGARVTVATTDADGPDRIRAGPEQPARRDGVEYWFFARTLPGEWKFSWPLTRWLAGELGGFDVVHIHSIFNYSTLVACRIAARRGVPYVLRPLGTLDPWSLSQRGWKKRPYYELFGRKHLRNAAAIHVTSEAEKRAVSALGMELPIRVIPLGVDAPVGGELTPRSPDARFQLLFLSRLHEKKGLPLLLEAVAALLAEGAAVDLQVAGSGEPDYEAYLRALVQSLGIGRHVTFTGHLEGEAKTRAFEQADLFVLPSYQENFGIAVAEALSAGLPVIVSDRVAIAEDIRTAGAGLVVPCEAEGVADAIRRLVGDAPERKRMAERASAFARAELSWQRTGSSLLQLYSEIARSSTASGAE